MLATDVQSAYENMEIQNEAHMKRATNIVQVLPSYRCEIDIQDNICAVYDAASKKTKYCRRGDA